jgi:carbon-monoxide dehydrogenase medium subunit
VVARFEYECPTDTAAAIALAARSDLMVKFTAGGQSLGPMLNLRLAQPDVLVDLTGIAELTQVEETADPADRRLRHPCRYRGWPSRIWRVDAAKCARIVYRAVRNRHDRRQYRPR